jgi:hypothetical protein
MFKYIFSTILLLCSVGYTTKYFLGVPIESSNGRPIKNATVSVYDSSGTTSQRSCTWQDGSRYYYTSPLSGDYYDVLVNGITLYDNIWIGDSYASYQLVVSFDDSLNNPHTVTSRWEFTDTLVFDDAKWSSGNVIYVPIGANIQTYIDVADSGNTLLLGSGLYTLTDTLEVDKPLNIIGQGRTGFVTSPVTPI